MKYKVLSGSFKKGSIIELEEVIEAQDLSGITLEESRKFWGHKDKAISVYTDKSLQEAAKENQNGHDWKLIYIHGYSLRELWENHTDFFWSESNPWYLGSQEKWADKKPSKGYYLLDFSKQLTSMTWDEQEAQLKKMKFLRAELPVIVEATIILHKLKKDTVLKDWYAWTNTRSSDGYLVLFGYVDATGAYVFRDEPDYSHDDLGAVPVR